MKNTYSVIKCCIKRFILQYFIQVKLTNKSKILILLYLGDRM